MVAIPILTNPIADLEILVNAADTSINLLDHFDDPFTTGLIAQFQLLNTDNTFPNAGSTEVVLFDQVDEGAPLTVENFQNYVEDGDYVNSIIHRSIPDFIIQGGGFFLNDDSLEQVPVDDSVPNEFSSDRSNVEGTIAMAKLGNDPDSATSQWFFNLGDNSENLDDQNSGFTAFGEVISDQDANTVNAIAELPTLDISQQLGSPFSDVPFQIEDVENSPQPTINDLVRYESINISQQEELAFTIINNSNPELVEASLESGNLTLNSLSEETGEATITVQATNLVGETVEDTFSVAVTETPSPQPQLELKTGGSTNEDNIEITDADTQNLLFVGSGEDTINSNNSETESNRFYGGTENDQLIVNNSDRAFGGNGNDILDASLGRGNNRLYGGAGEDQLLVGGNDRAFGGDGNDTLILNAAGGNFVLGGAGNDTFAINAPNTPNHLNTIADFTRGEDQITFPDFPELEFSDLRLTPTPDGEATLVGLENALVRLQGVQADTLTEVDFNF